MPLFLPSAVGDLIIDHAISSLPAEAVGLLAGKHDHVEMAMPLRNIARHRAFLANPYDQFQAERAIQSKGLELLAIYHSHPDGCACLSDLDVATARHWSCVHLVISLQTKPRSIHLRGYRLAGASPTEVELYCPEGQLHTSRLGWAADLEGCRHGRAER
jgi:proteasome lid subunit RPN8/RPN11